MCQNHKYKRIAINLRHRQTEAEKALWTKLRSKQLSGTKFRRQQIIGQYIVDFVNFDNKLIIEIDGGQHSHDNMRKRDEERTIWLKQHGFNVIRFWDNEVLQNIDGVIERIFAYIK